MQIAENPAVVRGAPLRAFFLDRATTSTRPDYNTRIYRPLRNVGFRAVARVAGPRPLAFGLANLALYALSTLLVIALARALDATATAAVWAAALWAVAPVHVEAVVYASALGDELSLALELAALLFAVRVVRGRASRPLADGAASVALALLAMLAKEMAVTEVALVALVALFARTLRQRRTLALVAAHGLVTLAYLALRTHVVGRMGQEDVTAAALLGGLRDAPSLLGGYLLLMLAPLGHRAAYVVPPPSVLALVLTLAALALVVILALRVDRKSGARFGLVFALAWVTLSLLPVLHVVPLWADLADRFALVPSVGLAVAGASLAPLVARALRPPVARAAGAAVAIVLMGGTLLTGQSYHDDLRLWTDAAEAEPRSSLAHANLGALYLSRGLFAEALAELDRARALGRDGAELELRRGMALDALGQPEQAHAAAEAALTWDPTLGRAHALLGDLARRQGRLDVADAELARARALAPDHPSTALLEAALAEARGQFADAARIYARLAAVAPTDGKMHWRLGEALLASGARAQAAEAARACLRIDADQPQCRRLLDRALDGDDRARLR